MDTDKDVQSYNTKVEEIDLTELFKVLVKGKFLIISITLAFSISAFIISLFIPDQYKASVLIAPSQEESSIVPPGIGQLGGLASLAGVNLGGSGGSEFKVAIEVMKSWSFIDRFIKENNLAAELYASKGWNSHNNTLSYDKSLYNEKNSNWIRENENGDQVEPSSWDLYQSFAERLNITESLDSGFVSISFEFYSPHKAKEWLDRYIASLNLYMQKRKIVKVTNNINYLQLQIKKISIAEMQNVLYSIIEEQMKSKMLAESSPEYAFIIVNQSMTPEEVSKPNRVVITLVASLLGLILSLLFVIYSYYGRNTKL